MASKKEWGNQENRNPKISQSPREKDPKISVANGNENTVNTLINKLQVLNLGETERVVTKQRFNFQVWSTPLKSIENVKSDSEDDAWTTPPNGCIETETFEKPAKLLASEEMWKCTTRKLSIASDCDSIVSNVTTPGWLNELVSEVELDSSRNIGADETIVLTSDSANEENVTFHNINNIDFVNRTSLNLKYDIRSIPDIEEENFDTEEDAFVDCTEDDELNSNHVKTPADSSKTHQSLTVGQNTDSLILEKENQVINERTAENCKKLENCAKDKVENPLKNEMISNFTDEVDVNKSLHEQSFEHVIPNSKKDVDLFESSINNIFSFNEPCNEISNEQLSSELPTKKPNLKISINEDDIAPAEEVSVENIFGMSDDNYDPSIKTVEHSDFTLNSNKAQHCDQIVYENIEMSNSICPLSIEENDRETDGQQNFSDDPRTSSNVLALIDGNISELVSELLDGVQNKSLSVLNEKCAKSISDTKMVPDKCLKTGDLEIEQCCDDVELAPPKISNIDSSSIMDTSFKEGEEYQETKPPIADEPIFFKLNKLENYQIRKEILSSASNKDPPGYPYIRITTPFKKNVLIRVPVSPEESDFTRKRGELLKCDKQLSKEELENEKDKSCTEEPISETLLSNVTNVSAELTSDDEAEICEFENLAHPSKRLKTEIPDYDIGMMDYKSNNYMELSTEVNSSGKEEVTFEKEITMSRASWSSNNLHEVLSNTTASPLVFIKNNEVSTRISEPLPEAGTKELNINGLTSSHNIDLQIVNNFFSKEQNFSKLNNSMHEAISSEIEMPQLVSSVLPNTEMVDSKNNFSEMTDLIEESVSLESESCKSVPLTQSDLTVVHSLSFAEQHFSEVINAVGEEISLKSDTSESVHSSQPQPQIHSPSSSAQHFSKLNESLEESISFKSEILKSVQPVHMDLEKVEYPPAAEQHCPEVSNEVEEFVSIGSEPSNSEHSLQPVLGMGYCPASRDQCNSKVINLLQEPVSVKKEISVSTYTPQSDFLVVNYTSSAEQHSSEVADMKYRSTSPRKEISKSVNSLQSDLPMVSDLLSTEQHSSNIPDAVVKSVTFESEMSEFTHSLQPELQITRCSFFEDQNFSEVTEVKKTKYNESETSRFIPSILPGLQMVDCPSPKKEYEDLPKVTDTESQGSFSLENMTCESVNSGKSSSEVATCAYSKKQDSSEFKDLVQETTNYEINASISAQLLPLDFQIVDRLGQHCFEGTQKPVPSEPEFDSQMCSNSEKKQFFEECDEEQESASSVLSLQPVSPTSSTELHSFKLNNPMQESDPPELNTSRFNQSVQFDLQSLDYSPSAQQPSSKVTDLVQEEITIENKSSENSTMNFSSLKIEIPNDDLPCSAITQLSDQICTLRVSDTLELSNDKGNCFQLETSITDESNLSEQELTEISQSVNVKSIISKATENIQSSQIESKTITVSSVVNHLPSEEINFEQESTLLTSDVFNSATDSNNFLQPETQDLNISSSIKYSSFEETSQFPPAILDSGILTVISSYSTFNNTPLKSDVQAVNKSELINTPSSGEIYEKVKENDFPINITELIKPETQTNDTLVNKPPSEEIYKCAEKMILPQLLTSTFISSDSPKSFQSETRMADIPTGTVDLSDEAKADVESISRQMTSKIQKPESFHETLSAEVPVKMCFAQCESQTNIFTPSSACEFSIEIIPCISELTSTSQTKLSADSLIISQNNETEIAANSPLPHNELPEFVSGGLQAITAFENACPDIKESVNRETSLGNTQLACTNISIEEQLQEKKDGCEQNTLQQEVLISLPKPLIIHGVNVAASASGVDEDAKRLRKSTHNDETQSAFTKTSIEEQLSEKMSFCEVGTQQQEVFIQLADPLIMHSENSVASSAFGVCENTKCLEESMHNDVTQLAFTKFSSELSEKMSACEQETQQQEVFTPLAEPLNVHDENAAALAYDVSENTKCLEKSTHNDEIQLAFTKTTTKELLSEKISACEQEIQQQEMFTPLAEPLNVHGENAAASESGVAEDTESFEKSTQNDETQLVFTNIAIEKQLKEEDGCEPNTQQQEVFTSLAEPLFVNGEHVVASTCAVGENAKYLEKSIENDETQLAFTKIEIEQQLEEEDGCEQNIQQQEVFTSLAEPFVNGEHVVASACAVGENAKCLEKSTHNNETQLAFTKTSNEESLSQEVSACEQETEQQEVFSPLVKPLITDNKNFFVSSVSSLCENTKYHENTIHKDEVEFTKTVEIANIKTEMNSSHEFSLEPVMNICTLELNETVHIDSPQILENVDNSNLVMRPSELFFNQECSSTYHSPTVVPVETFFLSPEKIKCTIDESSLQEEPPLEISSIEQPASSPLIPVPDHLESTPCQFSSDVDVCSTPRVAAVPSHKHKNEVLRSVKQAKIRENINKLLSPFRENLIYLCTPRNEKSASSTRGTTASASNLFECETIDDSNKTRIVLDLPTNLLDLSIDVLENMTAVISNVEPTSQVKLLEEKPICEGPSVKLIADLESPSSTREKTASQTVCSSSDIMVDRESMTALRLEKLTKEFDELSSKYEKLMSVCQALRSNEDSLKEALSEADNVIRLMTNRYELLKEYSNRLVIQLNEERREIESKLQLTEQELKILKKQYGVKK